MTRIVLDRLTKTYTHGAEPVIQDLSLSVQPGEVIALLGASGSGKSTILKLIAGIETPDAGDIRFDEQSILGIPANRRNAVMMFQKAYLFPFMSVADNIGFGLKVQRASKQTIQTEVTRMLEIVELPSKERRLPSQLSGGEQQRIALARALVTRPRVLMLDEPLSSLDTEVRLTLQESIRRIQCELNVTTLLVTHDLSEAVAMSDRIALLQHGEIVAFDRPETLFQRPSTRAAARFVGVSVFLEGQLEGRCLHTELGALNVSATAQGSRPATFAIRPENLRLLTQAEHNTIPGIIADCVYKGEFTEYQIKAKQQLMRVRSYQLQQGYAPGDSVHVQFPPESLFEVS